MTERTVNIYSEQSVPSPDGTKWAILTNEGLTYRLREKDLSGPDVQKLMKGKYLGRDVILTVSAGDLPVRIESLNTALG